MEIVSFCARTDNRMYLGIQSDPQTRDHLTISRSGLLHPSCSGSACFVVDPTDPVPIIEFLNKNQLRLELILNTHHQPDHTHGNQILAETFNAPVYCSEIDRDRIPKVVRGLVDGETIDFHGDQIIVLQTPGHTKGHLTYHLPKSQVGFVGDLLFSMGCGRLYEGTHLELYESLQKISHLPKNTRLYFGHEYTTNNSRFASHMEPSNQGIHLRQKMMESECCQRYIRQGFWISSDPNSDFFHPTIESEMNINPFLRLNNPEIRKQIQLDAASDFEVFTELRKRRDHF